MWVFATMSEYLLPLQIPTGKCLLRKLVFATVANTQVSICQGSKFGRWIFPPLGGYLLRQQIRREGICSQRQVFATAANNHSEYLLRLQLRYYPDIYFIEFFYEIRAKCTFVQQYNKSHLSLFHRINQTSFRRPSLLSIHKFVMVSTLDSI